MSATAIAATAVLDVAPAMATHNRTGEPRWEDQARGQRDLYTQFVISVTLGLSAFLAFCVCCFAGILSLRQKQPFQAN